VLLQRQLHNSNPIQRLAIYLFQALLISTALDLGTGINLFVAQDNGDIYNTTISLDDGPRANHFAYTPPKGYGSDVEVAYNLSLYDVQNLEDTTHTVNIQLDKGVSRLLFDYAAVTGDAPATRVGSSQIRDKVADAGTLLAVVAIVLAAGVI
jgi:hypothetical protein